MIGSDRAARIYEALGRWPRQRVRIEELWQVLDRIDPATRTSLERRQLLADALAELARTGQIALPGRQSFDRTEHPPLPRFVTLPRPAAPAETPTRVAWHPALAWAADAALTATRRATLVSVNDWLFTSDSSLTVPLRERSLEILGDEKAFDRLQLTDLFGPGRITLDLLRARRVSPPFHTVRVSTGPILLVVENSDTFDSLQAALQARRNRVGLVGWGAGAAFIASILSFATRAEGITDIAYFGDLDTNGLRIPASASRLGEANGLPRVRPATSLYEALRTVGRARPNQPTVDDITAATLASWLHPQHQAWATELLCMGARLAQEAVGIAYLSRDDNWLGDLR